MLRKICSYGIDFEALKTVRAAVSEGQKPTTNIDYTAALEDELRKCFYGAVVMFREYNFHEIATRLNSVVKAQQNCV
ncbi:MAG: hypothetical protein PHS93_09915 [Candidatus Omnitrophica bacterium]|nr:hypothetical protein [Candidatus Omnitrophota bacterium]MDD5353465.1 hypothetical protein [Candidatus Omnitrophota bacterium]